MCMVIADINLAICAKASEGARLISTKHVSTLCLSWGHGKAPFPVACCLVFSGCHWGLRLQRTQPILPSMSLLRELGRESSPVLHLGSQPVFIGAQSSSFGTLSSAAHSFFSLLTQTRISCRVFAAECLESPRLYQKQRDSVSCCTWRTIQLLYLGYEPVFQNNTGFWECFLFCFIS